MASESCRLNSIYNKHKAVIAAIIITHLADPLSLGTAGPSSLIVVFVKKLLKRAIKEHCPHLGRRFILKVKKNRRCENG